ncbi:hypothetical protein X747_15050 [Mesorhizobium sp. LNJC384A00]|uniref:hypothetical protein n=1 Tax=unclassified Mesorhizobium TaxID=325217 RepID=UPI0003CE9D2A|nr:hypothetical protein [Mesorhizobium sp. LNJC384A00]ESY42076.1 hypothetical protein X747_15050 [Mesorhizobium sp. LNJC384A00]
MREIALDDVATGNVGKFVGNKPAERWVAFSIHRKSVSEANEGRFPTMRQAIDWLVSEHNRKAGTNG